MKFKIKDKDVELKYTFNSFRYMQDFDLVELEMIERKPFLAINVVSKLLLGATNWTPNDKHSLDEVYTALESYMETESLSVLIDFLVEELQDSDFFKSLQRDA